MLPFTARTECVSATEEPPVCVNLDLDLDLNWEWDV